MFCHSPGSYSADRVNVKNVHPSDRYVLELADASVNGRLCGEIGLVVGAVSSVVSSVFRFDSNIPLAITAISGAFWLMSLYLSHENEYTAQRILAEYVRQNKNDAAFAELSRGVAQLVSEDVRGTLHLCLNALFLGNIESLRIDEREVEITLISEVKRQLHSGRETLHLPKKIVFNVTEEGALTFEESAAPYTCSVDTLFFQDHWKWSKLEIKEHAIEVTGAGSFNLCFLYSHREQESIKGLNIYS